MYFSTPWKIPWTSSRLFDDTLEIDKNTGMRNAVGDGAFSELNTKDLKSKHCMVLVNSLTFPGSWIYP